MEFQDINTNKQITSGLESVEIVEICDMVRPASNPVSSPENDNCKPSQPDRYKNINLGLVQTILFACFLSAAFAVKTTIIVISVFSVIDIISDQLVFADLIYQGLLLWPILILVGDFMPGWLLLFHNLSSERWKIMKSAKQKVIMVILVNFL